MGREVELERWVEKVNYGERRCREGIPGSKRVRGKTQSGVDIVDDGQ